MRPMLPVSAILLAAVVPATAYFDGAREVSCYDHAIIHFPPFQTDPAPLITCIDPCAFQLDLSGVVRNTSDASDLLGPVNSSATGEYIYDCGKTYQLAVRQAGINGFQGFLVQARDNATTFSPSSNIYGTWIDDPSYLYKPLYCNSSVTSQDGLFPNSATQRMASDIESEPVVPLYWRAPGPSSNPPTIAFWYTIVQQLSSGYYPVKGPVMVPNLEFCQIALPTVDCGPLTDPDNGQVNTSSGTTSGSKATYTCDTGYTLSGTQSRTCGTDGFWSMSVPTCEITDCGPLTDPVNGQVNTSSGTTFGSTATYTCDTGYTLSGSSSRTCGADGLWSYSSSVCKIIDCGSLIAPVNGQVNMSSGTTLGSTAVYTCNTGYTLSGSQSSTCGTDGLWSIVNTACNAVDCGPLTDPDNGQVNTSSGTTYGRTATYTCDTGYLLSGSPSSTCGADGLWSFSHQFCEAVIIVQIRFGRLNCIEYSSTNSLQKIEAISAIVLGNVIRLCSCQLNTSSLSNSQLQCFDESPQTVTFRTQLSQTRELLPYIEQWIESSKQLVVNGVRLNLNTSCPLVIPSFEADECISAPATSTVATDLTQEGEVNCNVSGTVVGTVGGIAAVLFLVLVVTVVSLVLCILHLKRRLKKQLGETIRNEVELQENTGSSGSVYAAVERADEEYEETDKLIGHSATSEQPHPVKGDYKYTVSY